MSQQMDLFSVPAAGTDQKPPAPAGVLAPEKVWNIRKPDPQTVAKLCEAFRFPDLIGAILVNRGIDTFEKVQQYTKPSVLNLHSPYHFRDMEKAVERVQTAIRNGEAILIFGDKDVDGVTATAILYKFLERQEANVVYRVPEGTDDYGLTKDVVRWASLNEIRLIITVDCGITSLDEIDYAAEQGIDVIVTDHHEPRGTLPKALAIVNPKVKEDGYPFYFLCGASVAFKLVCGIAEKLFLSDTFGQEIVFFDVETTGLNPVRDEIIEIGAVCVKNGVTTGTFEALIRPSAPVSAEITRITGITNDLLEREGLPARDVLSRFSDFIGNRKLVGHNAIEFDMKFLAQAFRKHLDRTVPNPVEDTLKLSHVLLKKLNEHRLNSVAQHLGVFVDTKTLHRGLADAALCAAVYRNLVLHRSNRMMELFSEMLPLAAVGTVADIMPLIEENRNIVKNGLKTVSQSSIGLIYLIRDSGLSLDRVSGKDVSWTVAPLLNSPGRVGNASLSVELLISGKIKEAEELVREILVRDTDRKSIMDDGVITANSMVNAQAIRDNKIAFLSSSDFTRGTTGLLANKLSMEHRVPAVVVSVDGSTSSGSVRSVPGFNVVEMLEKIGDVLIQYGGHKAAGGFTLKTEKLPLLETQLRRYMENVDLSSLREEIAIDTVLESLADLNLNMVRYIENVLEPAGNSNEHTKLLVRKVRVTGYREIGKEGAHVLLTVSKDGTERTVVGWNWTERLKAAFGRNGLLTGCFDVVGIPEINKFQGLDELRLNLLDIRPSENGKG